MRRAVLRSACLGSHCRKAFDTVAPYPGKEVSEINKPNDSHHISLHDLRAGELSQNQLDGKIDEQLKWQVLSNILNEFWHEGQRHELTREQQDERIIKLMDRVYTRCPKCQSGNRSGKQDSR